MPTIDGLVTGIDSEAIISGLLEIQQLQLDRLELKQSDVIQEQTAFSGLEAGLLSLRSAANTLARNSNSPFTRNIATVSDETKLAATASEGASQGSYRLSVDAIARSHQVASTGVSDADAEITTGTLEIRSGAGDLRSITIDSSNNTLNGLVDAINDSNAGVSASVIVDPSGGGNSHRILLSAKDTGAENAISVTNNLAASGGSATQITFDFGSPVQEATDATVTLGSGAGAIQVSSSTNQFDDLISGVRIDLLNATDGDEVTVSVRQDSEAAVTGVQNFVDAFNSFNSQLSELTKFDAGSGEGALLIGNRSAINLQQKIRTAVLDSVAGVSSDANRLSSVGVSVTDQGTLTFNPSKLRSILNGQVDGVGGEELKGLFASQASSTNAGVRFVLASARTVASEDPYQVDITQAAERAEVTATNAIAGSVVIDSSNRALTLSVDGAEATINLTEGTFTAAELADNLESAINQSSEFSGRTVRVGVSSDKITLASEAYGSTSAIVVQSGTALTDLGFAGGEADVGQDVEGSFIVNGQTELATGRGRILTGDENNENTADLKVEVTLDASQVVAGAEADLTVTRGVAANLDKVIGDLVAAETGLFSTLDDGFDSELESLRTAFSRQESLFNSQQEQLISQFVALETAMSQLQSTSSFLNSQLGTVT